MTDSKYFTTTKKGEVFELRADLSSDRKDKKKDAVKKVSLTFFYLSWNFMERTRYLLN